MVAEMTARELRRITLDESLALTALVVQRDPGIHRPLMLRLLEEDENLTIEEAAVAASALAALGGRGDAEALSTLSALPNARQGSRSGGSATPSSPPP
jgi:hypothetical protein